MTWSYLVVVGLTEIAWAIGLKSTDGFSRLWPGAGIIGPKLFSQQPEIR